MKHKLKYILPFAVIVVLLWGLLEFAEKAALLISITVLTSYLMIQFREEKKMRRQALLNLSVQGTASESPLLIAPPELSFEAEARNMLTRLLRLTLKLPQGRFKQDLEDINKHADRAVEALEAGRAEMRDCPALVRQLGDLIEYIEKYLKLQEQVKSNPALDEKVREIQAKIQKSGEKLKNHHF